MPGRRLSLCTGESDAGYRGFGFFCSETCLSTALHLPACARLSRSKYRSGVCVAGLLPWNGGAIVNRLAIDVIDDKDGPAAGAHLDWMALRPGAPLTQPANLIFGRSLRMIDDQNLHRALARRQLQPELLLERTEDVRETAVGGRPGSRRIAQRHAESLQGLIRSEIQIHVEFVSESGAIRDRPV